MDHRSHVYKKTGGNLERIRQRTRQNESNLRKKRREQLINRKRFRHDSGGVAEPGPDELTLEQVVEATTSFMKDVESRKATLKLLRQAFAQGTLFVDAFLGVDNTLQTLVGCLTSQDVDLQLESVWCFTNMSAGVHDHVLSVVKAAAPYLITYLSSTHPKLQDQCAWCLGNLAGDSDECRDLLKAQGLIQALLPLIKSPQDRVVRSAAFALSNVAKHSVDCAKELIESDLIPMLLPLLSSKTTEKRVLAEVGWVFSYLTTTPEHIEKIVNAGVLPPLVEQLVVHASEDQHNGEVITPLLRCLGNIFSGPDAYALQACSNTGLLTAIDQYMHSHHRHIQKESCWVLSNLAGTEELCDIIITDSIMTSLVNDVHADYDIKREAMYVACNLASHGKKYCDAVIAAGAMPYVVAILLTTDEDTIDVALSLIEILLRVTDNGKALFEENHGLTGLEALEYHRNDTLREKTNNLLETYFYKEEDKTNQNGIEENNVATDQDMVT